MTRASICERRDNAGLLEHHQVDLVDGELLQFGQADHLDIATRERREATLGQATVQRHLAALEADLVEAACARLLALVATTRGLAPAGADATTDAMAIALGAIGRFEIVQTHDCFLHSFSRGLISRHGPDTGPA
jgi:hypothetical protein